MSPEVVQCKKKALSPADTAHRALTEYPSASGGMTASFRRPLPSFLREREKKMNICLKKCFVKKKLIYVSPLMLTASNKCVTGIHVHQW